MPCRRLIGLLALLGAVAALTAGPAAARPPAGPLTSYPETLTSEHFTIHYTGELTTPPALPNPDRILHQQAGDLAANAERAYDLFVNTWKYPAPVDDGDGRVDIWVQKQATETTYGFALRETPTPYTASGPATAWLSISPAYVQNPYAIAHEVMHAIQMAMWWPGDRWLKEATAEWAAFAATGYAGIAGTDAAPDMSLDCESDACGNKAYETGGYSRWGFFQYLSERYGTRFAGDVFATGASLNEPSRTSRNLLATTLAAKGTTLGDVFNDYTAAHVAGAYRVEAMKGAAPTAYASIPVGKKTATLSTIHVAVNHLAARYVKFVRDTSNTGECFAATLALRVALPKNSASKPTFFSTSTGALPLSVSGGEATLGVPWSTCAAGGDGYLALPNPDLDADAQTFFVSSELQVGRTSLVAPSVPPPAFYTGPSVSAPTVAVAPAITVHGSEVVRVPQATRQIRLLVFASGGGQLRATLGDTLVGTAPLRAGNNDIRFILPEAAASTIRRMSAARTAANALGLTSLSPEGVAGDTVMRTLVVVAPAPAKSKTASRR